MSFAKSVGMAVVLALAGCGGEGGDSRAELEAQIAELEVQMSDLESQLAEAQAAGAASESVLAVLQTMLTTAEANLATATTDLGSSEANVAALTTQVTSLQAQIAAVNDVLASLAGTVTLDVPFVYGDSSLVLGASYPVAGTTDTVTFSEVRYWLSGVEFERLDGTFHSVPDSIYLVEARGAQDVTNGTENTVTLAARRRERIVIQGVPAGTYKRIRFHVGVDAPHNDDLSRVGGELHLLQNMTFDNGWMWFTSYIFTKTKGSVGGPGGTAAFLWDNGSNADYRTVELPVFASPIVPSAQHPARIEVEADLAPLVEGLSPRTNATIGAGTPAARTQLANGFAAMFGVVSAGEASTGP